MKYAYPEIGGYFDFDDGMIHSIVIENPDFFYHLLSDFQAQMDGYGGKGVVSVSDTPVELSKYVEVLDAFVPFEMNRKSLLTKITAALEKNAVNPAHYEKTMQFLRDAELYLDQIAFDFPCDIVFPKLSIGTLLKSVAPQLRDEKTSLCEKVLDYFELVCEFDRPKLFVLVNFRSYVNDRDLELFAKTVILHGYNVLMIESAEKRKLEIEKRRIIDEDLCEIC
jgi:CRISPR type II-A-associated protein Csn2